MIAGAGIGGLTAAIALRRIGREALLLEKARSLRPVGAGITLQINAMTALGRLGLAGAVAERGVAVRWIESRTTTAKLRARADLAPIAQRLGAPCISIERAALQQTLCEALEGVELRTESAVESFQIDSKGQSVRVACIDGENVEEGCALIGADGARSRVAAGLAPGATLSSPYQCWRAICPTTPGIPPATGCGWWGPGLAFGCFPIVGERTYWYCTTYSSANPPEDGETKRWLIGRLAGWDPRVAELVDATPAEAISKTPIYERSWLSSWGAGPVTLLGDAAHPMTPSMGQGGGMAIEDAVVLADRIEKTGSIAPGLRAYERARRPRTLAMVRNSRSLTQLAHAEGFSGRAGRWIGPWIPGWARARIMEAVFRFPG